MNEVKKCSLSGIAFTMDIEAYKELSLYLETLEKRYKDQPEGAEIVAIHTLPESHGTGLGAALLTEAMNRIGPQRVFLWTFQKNARARRFYEKHGFHWDGSERISEFDDALEVRYVRNSPQ